LNISKAKTTSALCYLVAATTIPLAHGVALAKAPGTVNALVLEQEHVYLGKTKVILTPIAVRMDGLGKFHFSVISKAPTWEVSAFRLDDQLIVTQSFEEFCEQGLFSNLVLLQKDRKFPPGGKVTTRRINNFPITQVQLGNTTFQGMDYKSYASPQAEQFLLYAYKMPTSGKLPIGYKVILTGTDWMTQLSEEGQKRVFLSTSKISYVPVSTAQFDVPTGLTPTKSVTRIIVGDTKKMHKTGVDVLFEFDK
jgi:hypothetical protein